MPRPKERGGAQADTAKIPRPPRIAPAVHGRPVCKTLRFRPFGPLAIASFTSGFPLKVAARVRIPLGVLR